MNCFHEIVMKKALELASNGRYSVSPNPMVGSIVINNNDIVGEGWHRFPGEPHAEIYALEQAGSQAKDGTLYVTLEPCCHYGRTPPCTKAIINAGIKKVIIASLDPNPLVSNKGILELQQAGISVEIGLCEAESQKLNRIYHHYHQHKRPYVILKWAMSLDGKTIPHNKDSSHITGLESQQHLHALRNSVDAILIGSNTLKKDNPQLTVREYKTPYIKHPLRLILTSQGNFDFHYHLFNKDLPGKTLIITTNNTNKEWLKKAENHDIEVALLSTTSQGSVNLQELLRYLAEKNITSLLVEGGQKTHHAFIQQKLYEECIAYVAPTLIAEEKMKQQLIWNTHHSLGRDHYFRAFPKEENNNV